MIIRTGVTCLQLHSGEELFDSSVESIDVLTTCRSEVGLAATALDMPAAERRSCEAFQPLDSTRSLLIISVRLGLGEGSYASSDEDEGLVQLTSDLKAISTASAGTSFSTRGRTPPTSTAPVADASSRRSAHGYILRPAPTRRSPQRVLRISRHQLGAIIEELADSIVIISLLAKEFSAAAPVTASIRRTLRRRTHS